MSDLATHWISPAWRNHPGDPGPGGVPPASEVVPPVIAVANPGNKPAVLTAYFYNHDGSIHLSVGTTVPAHCCNFIDTYDISETSGWLAITSDQPVAPWGTTQDVVQPGQRVNMTFFRVDAQKIKLPEVLSE
jgi:hypothetical protein